MFNIQLENWYKTHGRDLPWRQTSDPYLIMLSEFILQQTQVSQGMDYYLRFAERFPTVESLAGASEEEVLRLWQGLGYYSRARHLHAAAKLVAAAGHFPQDYGFVRALPGVGDYTAAAIMSFAFGEPYAVLDGNVQRVLSRHFGISEPIDTTQGRKLLRTLADEMLDRKHPALYNQAIMDFGALQCKPAAPVCESCPLAETCQALQDHTVDKLPVKAKRTAVRDRYLIYIYVRTTEGETLIHRRGSGDIWQGLFEFPLIESEKPMSIAEVEQQINCRLPFANYQLQLVACDVRHQLTHQRLHADFYCLTLPQGAMDNGQWIMDNGKLTIDNGQWKIDNGQWIMENGKLTIDNEQWKIDNGQLTMDDGRWVKESELDHYALPRLLEKLLEKWQSTV